MTIWLYFTADVLVDSVILIIIVAASLLWMRRFISSWQRNIRSRQVKSSLAMEIEFTDGNLISNYFLLDSRWTDKQEPLNSAKASKDPVAVFSSNSLLR